MSRLAVVIGQRHSDWVCLASGNPGEVRLQYKRPDPAKLEGITNLVYFDTDGAKDRRKVRPGEAPETPARKATGKNKAASS